MNNNTIWVSDDGKDVNPGTKELPKQTISAAMFTIMATCPNVDMLKIFNHDLDILDMFHNRDMGNTPNDPRT